MQSIAVTWVSRYTRVLQNFALRVFACMAQPMTKLMDKDVPCVWSPECEKSFAKLKVVVV